MSAIDVIYFCDPGSPLPAARQLAADGRVTRTERGADVVWALAA